MKLVCLTFVKEDQIFRILYHFPILYLFIFLLISILY